MSTVLDVSDANYKEFTDSAGAVVAYGLATCEPCKTYDPILEAIAANEFEGLEKFHDAMQLLDDRRAMKVVFWPNGKA